MSLSSKFRTLLYRCLVQPSMIFLYRRVYGMDIGREVRISIWARLDKANPKGVHIGDFTTITSRAAILTHDFVGRLHADVYIGRNCFIGHGAIVLPGVRIGDSVIVTGNSVVSHDVPPNSIVTGNPARIVESNIVTGPWGVRLDIGNIAPIRSRWLN
jgi:acetyltransferase-like isoleucine patch superfamily enzyme